MFGIVNFYWGSIFYSKCTINYVLNQEWQLLGLSIYIGPGPVVAQETIIIFLINNSITANIVFEDLTT